MRVFLGLSSLCLASAFLGNTRWTGPAMRSKRMVDPTAVVMSTVEKQTQDVSLSSGGGMFTSSNPESRRIGATE